MTNPITVQDNLTEDSYNRTGNILVNKYMSTFSASNTHNLAHNAICPILVVVMRGNKVKRSTYKSRNSIEFRPWFLLKRGRQPEVVMRRRGRDGRGS